MNDLTHQQNQDTAPRQPSSQSSHRLSRQTMVALFFFIATIVALLMYRYGTTHDFYDDTDISDWEEKTKAMRVALHTFWRNSEIFHFLIPLIGYSLLYKLASNKSARLFVILTVIATFVGMVLTWIYYHDIINHYSTEGQVNETLMLIVSCGWIATELCYVYAFSVLLRDKCLSAKSKSWICILVLRWILILSISVPNLLTGGMHQILNNTMTALTNENWTQPGESMLSYQDYFQNSGLYPILLQILTLLTAFALWHLARSEAFSKPYDATQPVRLSPVNKWVVAAVAGIVLVAGSLYLLYTTVLREYFIQ